MINPKDSYPLNWPPGQMRSLYRQESRFDRRLTIAKARDGLLDELRIMGASEIVISTNLKRRLDGLPYSNQRDPDDTGVAVYFTRNKSQLCMAVDKFWRIQDNLWSAKLCIEAIRGLERWGGKDFVNAAFTGFKAIPASCKRAWWEVMGYGSAPSITMSMAETRYRILAKQKHPDLGGSYNDMVELNKAIEEAREVFRGT